MTESKKPTGSKAKAKSMTDVAHPGKSAPSDTSKPIITPRPIMKDPMVVDEDTDKSVEETKKPLSKEQAEFKVMPTNAPAEAPEEKPAAEPEKPAAVKGEPAAKPATEEPDEKTDKGTDKKPKQPDPDAETVAQAEQEAKVQKIIGSKKYFLPINSVEQRRNARFVTLGIILVLLLAVAWVDIALDAGLIQIDGIKPVTHLFSS